MPGNVEGNFVMFGTAGYGNSWERDILQKFEKTIKEIK
jgi:hypothetical protein